MFRNRSFLVKVVKDDPVHPSMDDPEVGAYIPALKMGAKAVIAVIGFYMAADTARQVLIHRLTKG